MAKNDIIPMPIDPKNFACQSCELHKNRRNYVFPQGNMNGTILLVGEAPGQDEDLIGQPFVGRSGQLLKEILKLATIPLDQIMIHNCCMCRPPANRQPDIAELQACYPYLLWVIKNMPNLKIVILLGATALYSAVKLKKITEKRGTLIQRDGVLYLPILHPAAILRNPSLRELLERDIKFADEYINKKIIPGTHEWVTNAAELATCLSNISANDTLSVDIETSTGDKTKFSNFLTDDIIGVSFSWKDRYGIYVPFVAEEKEIWDTQTKEHIIKSFQEILTTPQKRLILHGGHFDAQFLRKRFNLNINKFHLLPGGIRLNYHFDTMYAHHLINENLPHDLDWLTRQFSDLAFYKSELDIYKKQNKIKNYAKIPLDVIGKYGAGDADGTFRLYKKFSEELTALKFDSLFHGLVMPLAMVLNETEWNGVKVDMDLLHKLDVEYSQKLKQQEGKIHTLAGEVFNINARDALSDILFRKLGIPEPKKRTEKTKKPSTEAEELEKLAVHHAIIPELLTYYGLAKLHSTYILSLMAKADEKARIHTWYKIDGTDTGRLSSKTPNLQNIPQDEQFRMIFIAKPGYSYVMADYSQIELRVMAMFSQDPVMLQTFKEGRDIHRETMAKILNKPADQVTDKERKIAKAINFGLMYGVSADGLASNPDLIKAGIILTRAEAQAFLDQYFRNLKGVKDYQARLLTTVRATKLVSTLKGRTRHIEDINSQNNYLRGLAERSALNAPIQGTAAECTNMAAVRIYFEMERRGIDGKLVLTVHDELVYETKNEQVREAAYVIYQIMRETGENFLHLPVEIDVNINDKWIEPNPADTTTYMAKLGLPVDLTKTIREDFLAGKRI